MKKEKCSVRLYQALKLRDMKQSELSLKTHIPKSAISQYLSGKFEPKQDRIEEIAKVLDVSEAWLMGYDVPLSRENNTISLPDNIIPLPNMNSIPLLGNIACGEPILAEENIECNIDIPEEITADFALRCKGDSMIDARILDGDIVYIKQQPTVNNGEIAAVLIGDEATLKKVYLSGDTLTLLACNSSYEPFVYSGSDLENIRIIGKAVGFTSKI